MIVLDSITVVCPRLLTVGDSVVLFAFLFNFVGAPAVSLTWWCHVNQYIVTYLLTYLWFSTLTICRHESVNKDGRWLWDVVKSAFYLCRYLPDDNDGHDVTVNSANGIRAPVALCVTKATSGARLASLLHDSLRGSRTVHGKSRDRLLRMRTAEHLQCGRRAQPTRCQSRGSIWRRLQRTSSQLFNKLYCIVLSHNSCTVVRTHVAVNFYQ